MMIAEKMITENWLQINFGHHVRDLFATLAIWMKHLHAIFTLVHAELW